MNYSVPCCLNVFVRHFRQELFFPKLLDRSYYEAWRDSGAQSAEERCRERKEDILKNHQAQPMDPDLDREFDRILSAARKELVA